MPELAHDLRPWWLSGEERCGFCLQRYVYEMVVRCVDCDRPMCPHCSIAVRARHQLHCPACVPAAGRNEG